MSYLKNLTRVLQETCPEETLLVTPSRALGRRMLAACAAEGALLVGVRPETPFTLARELCAGPLSRPDAPEAAEDSRCIELVRDCLREQADPGFFRGETGTGLGAAEALFHTFGELEMACVEGLSGSEKLEEIERLRRAYAQKKKEQGLLDRADLFRLALEQVRTGPLKGAGCVLLASYAPAPLERRLLEALFGDRIRVVEMDFPAETDLPAGLTAPGMPRTAALPGLKGRAAFVRCRGVETEVDFIFRDILEKKLPIGECAVVCLSGEYGRRIYETAGRYSVPVSVGAGIPLTGSSLYTGLKEISRLPGQEYDAEAVIGILSGTGCAPANRRMLVDALRKKKVGWGRERYTGWAEKYAADEKGRPDDAVLADWERCFGLMFALAEPAGDLETQRADLLAFVTEYYKPAGGEQGAAYAQTLRLAGQITALGGGETLLSRLLAGMEQSNYLFGPAAEGTLFCAPLSQSLCTGRKHLYVVGLSRYALQGSRRESPILLDAERAAWPALQRISDRERELTFRFLELLLHHEGDAVLTYPDFDSDGMLPQLPAPLYREAMEACGGKEIRVDYLKAEGSDGKAAPLYGRGGVEELLHAVRPPIPELPDPTPAGEGEAAGLREELSLKQQIRNYVFSPSSLETALGCPLQFYYQKLLRLYPADKLERSDGRWLEKNTVGTFCHRVLERYYAEQAADVTPIFEEEKKLLEREYPAVRRRDMEADFRKMRTMVDRAIAWTAGRQITVLSTEADFGKEGDGMASKGLRLKIGSRELLLTGSIDRVDRRPDGTCAILDYKTGNSFFFRRDMEKHLQHYLYTLAEEELFREEQRSIASATYLFLEEEDNFVEIPQDPALRKQMEQKLEELLRQLEKEETAQTPCPCFGWDPQKGFVPARTEVRQEEQKNCRSYCKYAGLCPDVT